MAPSPWICDEGKVPESSIKCWLIVKWLINIDSFECACTMTSSKTNSLIRINLTQFQMISCMNSSSLTHLMMNWRQLWSIIRWCFSYGTADGEAQSLVNLQMIRFRLVFVRIEFFSALSLRLAKLTLGGREKNWEWKQSAVHASCVIRTLEVSEQWTICGKFRVKEMDIRWKIIIELISWTISIKSHFNNEESSRKFNKIFNFLKTIFVIFNNFSVFESRRSELSRREKNQSVWESLEELWEKLR